MLSISLEQEQYLDQKEAFLDQFIDLDDEYLLFISSYIHGHFSVVAAKLANAISDGSVPPFRELEDFQIQFEGLLKDDINKAITDKELSDSDAKAVLQMLSKMFSPQEQADSDM